MLTVLCGPQYTRVTIVVLVTMGLCVGYTGYSMSRIVSGNVDAQGGLWQGSDRMGTIG